MVYKLVLVKDVPIWATTTGGKRHRALKPWNEPALLRTCRQVRDEAIPVFYSANVFQFHARDLPSQPRAMMTHAKKLRRIQVKLPTSSIKLSLKRGLQDCSIAFFEIRNQELMPLPPNKLLDGELHYQQRIDALLGQAVARREKTMNGRLLEEILRLFCRERAVDRSRKREV